jgi:hypothetical protein
MQGIRGWCVVCCAGVLGACRVGRSCLPTSWGGDDDFDYDAGVILCMDVRVCGGRGESDWLLECVDGSCLCIGGSKERLGCVFGPDLGSTCCTHGC